MYTTRAQSIPLHLHGQVLACSSAGRRMVNKMPSPGLWDSFVNLRQWVAGAHHLLPGRGWHVVDFSYGTDTMR